MSFNLIFLDDRVNLLEQFENYLHIDYENLDIDCNDQYVIVATRSHNYDFKVVEYLKDQNFKYLGVLGSKKKVGEMFKTIEINKNNIYAPVGLKISNQNPHEIAISIAAQILAHKNNKLGGLNDW